MQLARIQLQEARGTLTLQQALSKPNIEALAGYKRTNGYNTLLGGVQVDLPFQNRNQGNITAATAGIGVAESNLAATEALVRAEVQGAQADYLLRRRQVFQMLDRMKNQADETSRIALGAYRLGGADLLRLLDAERLRIDIESLSLRALVEYRQSIVALEAALGVQP
jgi:cobalt-zinc-cadmium efflux system outer membrane protein